VPIKQLLGQTDRQIKRLIEEPENTLAEAPPAALVGALLDQLAHAGANGERVNRIKKTFERCSAAPETVPQRYFDNPNIDLMQTVASAIKEDVAHIKDALDIFVRTGNRNAADLAPAAVALKNVGDTLAVSGLSALARELEPERERLDRIAAGALALDEEALMHIAEALVVLEDRLDDVAADTGAIPATDGVSAGAGGLGTTFKAVLRESLVNLGCVKDAIAAFANDVEQCQVLDPVPASIAEIQAGLRLLNLIRPAALLGSIAAAIRRIMSDREIHP
jgi:chemosensory pili system protein ChpA (sensor histidine kinase/response regulator)